MGLRARSRLAAALVAAAALVPAPGCDWLKASDTMRVSPFLRNLTITPETVQCGRGLTLAFDYDDPQDDIAELVVTFRGPDGTEQAQDLVSWEPPGEGLNLSVSGLASYRRTLECDQPGGRWTAEVTVEDRRSHKSNLLSGSFTFVSAR